MHNSGARTLPKAGPRWFLELCFSCLLHQISSYPDEPSRDRAPPLNIGVQPAARRDTPPPPCLRRTNAGYARCSRALGKSLSSSND